jgi:DNA-binding phage protein
MSSRRKTAFELDFERDMRDPEFRAAYKRARAHIDAIDRLVRKLDTARETQGISKAELARRMNVPAETIRRLFSTDKPNPTVKTAVAAADALGLQLTAVPKRKRTRTKRPTSAKKRQREKAVA